MAGEANAVEGHKPVQAVKEVAAPATVESKKEPEKNGHANPTQAFNDVKGNDVKAPDKGPTASTSSNSSSDSDSDSNRSTGLKCDFPETYRYPYFTTSASYRQLDFVGGWHQYTLTGFSIATAMGCGMRLCSDFFRVAGQLFRLEVYPAGFTTDVRKHMSVFLTTPGSIMANQVFHEISILDQARNAYKLATQDARRRDSQSRRFQILSALQQRSGKGKHITAKRDKKQGPCVCMYRGVLAAHPGFVKLKELFQKSKRYLRNDTLVIRVTVEVVRSWSSRPGPRMPTGPPNAPRGLIPAHYNSPPPAAHHSPYPPGLPLEQAVAHSPHSHTRSPGYGHLEDGYSKLSLHPHVASREHPNQHSVAQHSHNIFYESAPLHYADNVPMTGPGPYHSQGLQGQGISPNVHHVTPGWIQQMPAHY